MKRSSAFETSDAKRADVVGPLAAYEGEPAQKLLFQLTADSTSWWHGVPHDIATMVDEYLPPFMSRQSRTDTQLYLSLYRTGCMEYKERFTFINKFIMLDAGLMRDMLSFVDTDMVAVAFVHGLLNDIPLRFRSWLFAALHDANFACHVPDLFDQIRRPGNREFVEFVADFIETCPLGESIVSQWVDIYDFCGSDESNTVTLAAAFAKHAPAAVWRIEQFTARMIRSLNSWSPHKGAARIALRLLRHEPASQSIKYVDLGALLHHSGDDAVVAFVMEWLQTRPASFHEKGNFLMYTALWDAGGRVRENVCDLVLFVLQCDKLTVFGLDEWIGRVFQGGRERCYPPLITPKLADVMLELYRREPDKMVSCMAEPVCIDLLKTSRAPQLAPLHRHLADHFTRLAEQLVGN